MVLFHASMVNSQKRKLGVIFFIRKNTKPGCTAVWSTEKYIIGEISEKRLLTLFGSKNAIHPPFFDSFMTWGLMGGVGDIWLSPG